MSYLLKATPDNKAVPCLLRMQLLRLMPRSNHHLRKWRENIRGKSKKMARNSKLRLQRRHFYFIYRWPGLRWVDGRIAFANDELVLRLGGGGVVIVATDWYMAHYSAQIKVTIKCRCMDICTCKKTHKFKYLRAEELCEFKKRIIITADFEK